MPARRSWPIFVIARFANTVRLSTECPEWRFGTGALMRNLAARDLLDPLAPSDLTMYT